MTFSLSDRVIIVTGAGAGIGYGVLRMAIAAGARVTGFDINNSSEHKIVEAGGRFQCVDVSDTNEFSGAISAVRMHEGRLDGIVNNAGITIAKPFLEFEIAAMDKLWSINQRAVLVGCQAAARIMVADHTPGSIVNIGSNHVRASDEGYEAYAGTKGAVSAMSRAMAWSLGAHGIRVNTLAPGLTLTEVVKEVVKDPAEEKRFQSWHASSEISTVEEIGHVAVFLLSDASIAITGSEIIADKGMTSRLGDLQLRT